MRGQMKMVWVLAVWVVPWAWGQTSVTVPWEDVKRLQEESIERKIVERMKRETVVPKPQRYSVDEALCRLKIGRREARGNLYLRGCVLDGNPEPIRLFGTNTVVAGVVSVQGGILLPACGEAEGLCYLPTNQGPFQVELDVILPVREDAVSLWVETDWPRAVCSTVELGLEDGLRLLDPPGYAGDQPGTYRLPGRGRLAVRFAETARGEKPRAVEMDVFTRIRFKDNRVVLGSWFLPARADGVVEVIAPPRAQLLGSSLPESHVRGATHGSWTVECADAGQNPFFLEFVLPDDPAAGIMVTLPSVKENRGKEGYFTVDEPQDGEVEVHGEDVLEGLAVTKLAPAFLRAAGSIRSLACAARGQAVRVVCRPYTPVARPSVVLEAIDFTVTFEESGATLVEMSATVPPEAGSRLFVRATPGMEVWSLKVDGAGRSVYGDGQGRWVVPLAEGKPSHVELALLRKGEKMGLQGRAEAALPETALLAQVARVRLSLPARLDLLSVEGPVSPSPGAAAGGSAGQRTYGFVRPFYKGEAMALAAFYKEPVRQAKGE